MNITLYLTKHSDLFHGQYAHFDSHSGTLTIFFLQLASFSITAILEEIACNILSHSWVTLKLCEIASLDREDVTRGPLLHLRKEVPRRVSDRKEICTSVRTPGERYGIQAWLHHDSIRSLLSGSRNRRDHQQTAHLLYILVAIQTTPDLAHRYLEVHSIKP